jgi:6-pyruvoyltetrahydropterin/6-carboxytetrahydropterin synthase
MYRVTKTYDHNQGLSCAFRQWRAESHCRFIHGYALAFVFVFEAATLDAHNWVIDFGNLDYLKQDLKRVFDHTTMVASDDPNINNFRKLDQLQVINMFEMAKVGCEAFAEYGWNLANSFISNSRFFGRVRVVSCEVKEHGGNSATYIHEESGFGKV